MSGTPCTEMMIDSYLADLQPYCPEAMDVKPFTAADMQTIKFMLTIGELPKIESLDLRAAASVPQARVHELLVGARNHIARLGWAKSWGANGGPICIMAGIGMANGLRGKPIATIRNMAEGRACAQAMGFPKVDDAMRWNDHMATKEMVLARLDEAIRKTAPEPEDLVIEPTEVQAEVVTGRELVLA